MSILAEVRACLEAMDVEGASDAPAETVLGDELGMDSQELVFAAVHLGKRFEVKVDLRDLSRRISLLELSVLLAKQVAATTLPVALDDGFTEDSVIESSLEDVYRALFEFEAWPEKLPHVRGVRKHYDDGVFQEFEIDVQNSSGSVVSVRSVRRCEPGKIRFFQPTPPRFLRHHCGGWILNAVSERLTHIVTWHQWRLSTEAGGLFPPEPGVPTSARIHSWLHDHARFALKCWKICLEGKGNEKNVYN